MNRLTPLIVLGIAALVPCSGISAPSLSAETFGSIPRLSEVVLSPDGSVLAWQDADGPNARIVMFDVTTKEYRRQIPVDPNTKLRRLVWADNETLLMTFTALYRPPRDDSFPHEVTRIFAVDLAGGESRQLVVGAGADRLNAPTLLGWHTGKPHTVVMGGAAKSTKNPSQGLVPSIFEVDTRSGEGTIVDQSTDPMLVDRMLVDHGGKPLARAMRWGPYNTIERRRADQWQAIFRSREGLQLYGLSADGSAVLAAAFPRKRLQLWLIPLDGSRADLIAEGPGSSIFALKNDPLDGSVIAAAPGDRAGNTRWFDSTAERYYKAAEHTFPGRRVTVFGRSEDYSRLLVGVDGPSAPRVYYLVDHTTHRADIVGETYPELSEAKLGAVRTYNYKARDGVMLNAFLTLPPGSVSRNLPLIVLQYQLGEREHDYFNWLDQFVATRGYAVLDVQSRAPTGHTDLEIPAWDLKIVTRDIADGIKALVDEGTVDSNHVCSVGVGDGGYVVLTGAAYTPELYKCVASINGWFDQREMGKDYRSRPRLSGEFGIAPWIPIVGKSPVDLAASINAAVLLVHAREDSVIPAAQSELLAHLLERLHKSVMLVSLDSEDHELSQSSGRIQMLKVLDEFLATHLRPPGTSALLVHSEALPFDGLTIAPRDWRAKPLCPCQLTPSS